MFTKNNHELAPIVLAALVSGNPMNGLDPTLAEAEIAHLLGVTKPKAVFCDMDMVEILKLQDSPIVSFPVFQNINVSSVVQARARAVCRAPPDFRRR